MTEHLPECTYLLGQPGFGGIDSGISSTQPHFATSPCICPALLAYGNRLKDCDSHGEQIRYRCEHYRTGWRDGHGTAIDAVVVGLWEIKCRYEAYSDAMPFDGASLIFTRDAVAAADALRKEP